MSRRLSGMLFDMTESAKIRAAIIEPVGGHGGMNFYDFGLASGLEAAGVPTMVYTCDETMPPLGATFLLKLPFRGIYGDNSKYLRGLRFLRGMISAIYDARRQKADIAHFHIFHTTGLELASVLFARLARLKVVVTAHDIESFSSNSSLSIARRIYGYASVVIAHNAFSRDELIQRLGIPTSKIAVIPHGNYLDAINHGINRTVARKRLGLPPEVPLLLFFGQIKQVKGLDLLLEALPTVIQAIPSVKLLIAGKVWKTSFEEYQAIIDRLQLSEHVISDIRYIPDPEADLYYSAADLSVFPYRKIYQSGALLMAMSYGRPVVVSDLPGMLETVQDGANGYVFRSGDARHLAACLVEALQDKTKTHRVAEGGYMRVVTENDWRRIGQMTRDAYESVWSR